MAKSVKVKKKPKKKRLSYDEYLRSKHWLNFRKEFHKRNKYQCWACLCTNPLHIHHITYCRLGKERKYDCIYLCEKCHNRVHLLVDEGLSLLKDAHINLVKYGNLTDDYIQFIKGPTIIR